MKAKLYCYLSVLLCLLFLDGIWLGLVAKDSYQVAMGHIMREKVIVWPWMVFYLLYPLAIFLLAITANGTAKQSAWKGSILGATAYGTYNLTNYALVIDWPLIITFKDWGWGIFLTASSAWLGGAVRLRMSAKQVSPPHLKREID